MIMRLLVIVGLIGLAYYALQRFLAPAQKPKKPQASFQPMVRCEYCGLHVPQAEAIARTGDKYYCSNEHAALQQQK